MPERKQKTLYLLDGGHAPATAGKRSPKLDDGRQLVEWEFARDVVGRIAARLEEEGVAHHVLTPKTVYDLGPSARAKLANAVDDDAELPTILISVHANAAGNGGWYEASGLTVLYWHTSSKSKALAEHLLDKLGEHTGLDISRGVKGRDNLSILEKTRMPAVLSENGFYTDEDEVEFLLSDAGRQRIAEAHVQFILSLEQA